MELLGSRVFFAQITSDTGKCEWAAGRGMISGKELNIQYGGSRLMRIRLRTPPSIRLITSLRDLFRQFRVLNSHPILPFIQYPLRKPVTVIYGPVLVIPTHSLTLMRSSSSSYQGDKEKGLMFSGERENGGTGEVIH